MPDPVEPTTTTTPTTSDTELLLQARSRFRVVADAEASVRALMLEDLRFRAGEHWDPQIVADRKLDHRPVLTIDKLRQPLRQIVNQQRQSKLAIDVHPKGGASTDETAEVFQGLIRHIEVQSSSDVAYSWAFEYAASIGRGFWRVLTEYANDGDDDQDITIKRVVNPFTVYPDPSSIEADYSDMRYCFVVEDLDPDEFHLRYPDAEPLGADVYRSIGDETPRWLPGGRVRVAEYWYVTETKEGRKRTVTQAVISGAEVLERNQWAGRYIPIVPVIGEELDVDGERVLQGIVRSAKDPQRMYDYWVTAQTEMIALAPRAPFIMAEGQDENHPEWKTSNTRNHARLVYKPTTVGGQLVPAPVRQFAEPPIQAITLAVGQANEDIKGTTGIFDPSLGRLSPSERSGRAITALQTQGNTANANFLDNLARAITYTGKILVDLIPHIYDRPGRIARLLGEDDEAKAVMLNAPFAPTPQGPQPVPPQALGPQGELPPGVKHYDLSKGQYSVTVSVGPGYQTRRQEGADAIQSLIQANPSLAPLVADVWVDSLEFPGHRKLAKRLAKALPPNLQDDDGQNPQVPPKVQGYIQQLEQQHQTLTQIVEKLTDDAKAETIKQSANAQMKSAELASRERIAALQIQADLLKTKATIDAKNADTLISGEFARIQQMLDQMHELVLAGGQQAQDQQLAGQEQQQAQGEQAASAAQQQQQQAHEQQLAAQQQGHERELASRQQGHEAQLAAQQQGHEQELAAAEPAEGE